MPVSNLFDFHLVRQGNETMYKNKAEKHNRNVLEQNRHMPLASDGRRNE